MRKKDCGTKGKMYVRASVSSHLHQLCISQDSSLSPVWCLLPCWGCKWLLLSYSLCYKRGTGSDCRRPGQLIMAENDPCPQRNVETVSLNGFTSSRRNFPRIGKDGWVPDSLSGTSKPLTSRLEGPVFRLILFYQDLISKLWDGKSHISHPNIAAPAWTSPFYVRYGSQPWRELNSPCRTVEFGNSTRTTS